MEQESNPEQPVAMKMLPPSQLTSQMSSITTRSDFTEGPEVEDTQAGMKRGQRECPIPKPGGLVGEILGFRRDKAIEMGSKDEVSSARTIDAVNKIERIANGNGERPP